MLKIDNESLTDKTTVVWENESGIMSTFTLRIETYSEDLGDIKLEFRTTLTKDELDDIKDEITLKDSVEEIKSNKSIFKYISYRSLFLAIFKSISSLLISLGISFTS